jgi:hypothetical protein
MQIIITSPDALRKKSNGELFVDVIASLKKAKESKKVKDILAISTDKTKLCELPDFITAHHAPDAHWRSGKKFIENILSEHAEFTHSDITILGANNNDFYLSSNNKLLLLTAKYSAVNNPSSKIYAYGIHISDSNALDLLFDKFLGVREPWYRSVIIDDCTTVYSMINANTKTTVDHETVEVMTKFRECLKDGEHKNRTVFALFFLIAINKIDALRESNYWGIFPSAGIGPNEDLEYFKELGRKVFNIKSSQPMFVRTKQVTKRHLKDKATRISEGCDQQFDSIIVDKYYEKKIPGNCVCVIDDFTTYGTSCETARHLLQKAGAKRIIFLTMGKFGYDYYKYDYTISGDVFGRYSFTRNVSPIVLPAATNPRANIEFLQSLRGIIT